MKTLATEEVSVTNPFFPPKPFGPSDKLQHEEILNIAQSCCPPVQPTEIFIFPSGAFRNDYLNCSLGTFKLYDLLLLPSFYVIAAKSLPKDVCM